MQETCVLIPSYNESPTIGSIVKNLRSRGFTVYVIDDGSTDDTADMARREGAIVVQHKTNKGKGAAIREGFSHVVKKGFDRVVVMDGDDQHSRDDLDKLMETMDNTGADMVIGDRMADTAAMPRVRVFVNHFMSFIISRIAGTNIPDTQCGFRIIKRALLEKVRLESSNYEIESELILEAAKKGFKIASCPIKTVYQGQASKINPVVDTLRFFAFLFRMALRR